MCVLLCFELLLLLLLLLVSLLLLLCSRLHCCFFLFKVLLHLLSHRFVVRCVVCLHSTSWPMPLERASEKVRITFDLQPAQSAATQRSAWYLQQLLPDYALLVSVALVRYKHKQMALILVQHREMVVPKEHTAAAFLVCPV